MSRQLKKNKMYQDLITNCINIGSDYTCTIPFSSYTGVVVSPTITSGELLIAFFLFLLLLLKMVQFLLPAVKSVKVHRSVEEYIAGHKEKIDL